MQMNSQIFRCTVGENIIGAPKMQNNDGTIQLSFIQYCDNNIGLCFFSLLLMLFIKLSLFQLLQERYLSQFLYLRGDSKKYSLPFAITFKSEKSDNYCYRIVRRQITICEGI